MKKIASKFVNFIEFLDNSHKVLAAIKAIISAYSIFVLGVSVRMLMEHGANKWTITGIAVSAIMTILLSISVYKDVHSCND